MMLRFLAVGTAGLLLAACGNSTYQSSQVSTAATSGTASSSGSSSSSSGSSTSSGSSSSSSSGSSSSSSSGASAPSTYLPYSGQSSSLLASTQNLAAPPAAVDFNVVSISADGGLFTNQLQLNASNQLSSFERYSSVFVNAGPDGNYHVYGVQLADVVGVPTPAQLSNLSLPQMELCGGFVAPSNILDATTLLIFEATSVGCNVGNTTFQLIHWTDSPTTAPTPTQIPSDPLAALYNPDGSLGGLLVYDIAQGNLDFVAASNLTGAPSVLVSNVTGLRLQYESSLLTTGSLAAGSTEFVDVTTNSGEELLRVSYTGAASAVYQVTGILGGFVADASNLYFYDAVSSTSQQHVYEQPLDATSPAEIELFTASPVVYNPHAVETLVPMQLLGADGQQLVVATTIYDLTDLPTVGVSPPLPVSTSIQSLSVGVSGSPTTLLGPFNNMWVSAFMATPSPGNYASQVVYVSELIPTTPGAAGDNYSDSYTYSSEMLSAIGTVLVGPLANTAFVDVPRCDQSQSFALASNFYGPVLQFSGITDSNGQFGGSTVTNVAGPGSPATPLQDGNGNNFVIPANTAPILCAVSSSLLTGSLASLNANFGPARTGGGTYSTLPVNSFGYLLPQTGVAISLSLGQMVEIAGSTLGY